jgi:hypothetical protein
MNRSTLLYCVLVFTASLTSARGGDWMTWRSTYTHDAASGHRVDQYAPTVAPIAPDQGNLVRSGYRHYRSTIQAGQSADNLHVVHEWGRPVMPYEHWRFPYRPYGAPYAAWGPPTPNVLGNVNYGVPFGNAPYGGSPGGNWSAGYGGAVNPNAPGGGQPANTLQGSGLPSGGYPGGSYPGGNYPGGSYPGGAYPGGGYPGGAYPSFPLVPPFQPAPWYDGFYPSAPPLDNQSDRSFFYRPPSSMRP